MIFYSNKQEDILLLSLMSSEQCSYVILEKYLDSFRKFISIFIPSHRLVQ